jgi:hypothetical protein
MLSKCACVFDNFIAAKNPKSLPADLSSWVEGFELREQFTSSGDFKYIESKMHTTMSLTGQLFSGYEILQVSWNSSKVNIAMLLKLIVFGLG